jgi:dinuclear metal center YbgI/SA1388 family protein
MKGEECVGITLGGIAALVDELAPFKLAYEWDNVGLQVGDPRAPVQRLLIALELDSATLAFARENRCDAILAHHPLIFSPQRSIRADNHQGALLIQLIRSGIGLVVAHTNLDRVACGTNGALAALMSLRDLKMLEPHGLNDRYKFTVFVPRDYTAKIIEAIHRGGGGRIGNYSHCSFRVPGTGTYVPGAGANPFQGQSGRLEKAQEDRLEAIVPRAALKRVVREVLQAHPYEEVAYDVCALHDADPEHGLGLTGQLPSKTTLGALARLLHEACNATSTSIIGAAGAGVRRVAIVTGSAGSAIDGLSPGNVDVFVTGELNYHRAAEARDRGLNVIALGHAASEKVFAGFLKDRLLREPGVADAGLEILAFERYADPLIPVANGKAGQKTRSKSAK